MIEDLKPYSEYKDSGLPWLGEVPAHWEIARSKRLFKQRKEFAQPEDQQLSATQAYGVIPQALYEQKTGYRVVKISMHLDKRKHVQADDFVISMRSFQGGLERAWAAGAIRSSYVVLEPSKDVAPGYFQYLFKSHQYINALRATSDFIRDGQDLNFDNFCGVALPLIPLQEQTAIACFLTWATNRLDRAIRAKRRIIALLNEQKQAIIHRAVTRGLDPSVPLRDSGISWLGEIPEHWEVRRLKGLATVQTGITLGKDYGSSPISQYPYLRVANVQSDRLDLRNVKHVAVPEVEAKRSTLMHGDVLMTEGGDIDKLGRGCLWSGELAGCLHQNHVFAVRCSSGLIPGFLVALMGSAHGRGYFQITAKQTTNLASTNSTTLKVFPLLLPEIQEQQKILSFIDGETQHFSRAITDTEREITLLREYRTRLITDVVTGNLDVRQAAAGLPEEIEPLDAGEPGDEIEELDPDEEVDSELP
jgi:type I restriction enzyme S subunit